jgi:hypothetical protein
MVREMTFMRKTLFKVFVLSMMTGFIITFNLSLAYAVSDERDKAQKGKNSDSVEISVAQIMENAKRGDITAQYNLALIYAEGKRITKNMDQAASWLLKAANQGHLEAQHYLASLYESGGWGFPKDRDKSEYWSNLGGRFPSSTTGNQRQVNGSKKGIFFSWIAISIVFIVFSLIALTIIINKKKIKTLEPKQKETVDLGTLESDFDQNQSIISGSPQSNSEAESDITFDDLSDSGSLKKTDSSVEPIDEK